MSLASQKAGNTVSSLRAVDVLDVAKSTTVVYNEDAMEREMDVLVAAAVESDPELKLQIETDALNDLDYEAHNACYVTREEFDALLARIDKYNIGAPHKI